MVYLKKAPCFTWIIWRRYLVLLGSFEESSLFYLVYLKKAPCFTWIPLQLDFSLTQVALVRRLEVEDLNWDSQKWIFFATFSLLAMNRQFWGSNNLPRSRESHWSPAWVKIVWILVQNFTSPVHRHHHHHHHFCCSKLHHTSASSCRHVISSSTSSRISSES